MVNFSLNSIKNLFSSYNMSAPSRPATIKGEFSFAQSMEQTHLLHHDEPESLHKKVYVFIEEKPSRDQGAFYTSLTGKAKIRTYTVDSIAGTVHGEKLVFETSSGLGEATIRNERSKNYPVMPIDEFLRRVRQNKSQSV